MKSFWWASGWSFFVSDSFWTLFRDKNEKENRLFFDSEFLEFSLESDEIDETDKSCVLLQTWFKPKIELEGIWQKPKCLKNRARKVGSEYFSGQKFINKSWTILKQDF